MNERIVIQVVMQSYSTRLRLMFTLYGKAVAPAQKPYRLGLLFTHIKERRFERDFCNGAKLRRGESDIG